MEQDYPTGFFADLPQQYANTTDVFLVCEDNIKLTVK